MINMVNLLREKGPEEEMDLSGPDLVNLVFASALPDNKGSTVLEALQDVVMYCWALNIPIVRFHCDRGMEFYAKATRQWIKYHGMRFTTSEGGLHQQNGMVENAVKYIKQRARTLLIGAKLPQRLWPQAASMAASMQRATTLGMETRLAAPFGTKVLVRRREYGGTAEPGKPDDLAPRWLEGRYLGLSDTLRRGHIVYLAGDDGEKFVHTVHVRVGVEDPEPLDTDLQADLPGPPSRRVREKARGSGDVVAVSKVQILDHGDRLELRARELLQDWSQEEAEKLIAHVSLGLDPGERKFGVFRHGGSVGLTKITYDKPWVAEVLVRAFKEKCPDAEFSAVYVSVNTSKDLHADSNNLTGMPNYVYPLVLPRSGGNLWIELLNGDVVRGKITEMLDVKGHPHYGCTHPLTTSRVTSFDPHRRHAVLPWKGMRVVMIAYTPGAPQNIKGPERVILSQIGFPVPTEVPGESPLVALRTLSIQNTKEVQAQGGLVASSTGGVEVETSDGEVMLLGSDQRCEGDLPGSDQELNCSREELFAWDMFIPLEDGDPEVVPKAMIASSDHQPGVHKAEVSYTKDIEHLLGSLEEPLSIVHTVDPAEAASNFPVWIPAVTKEISSFDKAKDNVYADDPRVIQDVKDGNARIVPMKIVYTVKPPDEVLIEKGENFKRKARIVACGNLLAQSGEETYAGTAPAEVVRSSLAISSCRGWDAAILDVTAAFLQTPLKEVQCKQRILGQPPRVLVREGLCAPNELWEFSHAIYGLRESPRWWGQFRDAQLAQINLVIGEKKIQMVQCRVEGSWWKLQDGAVLIGILVVYVDDLLICSTPPVIRAVADAIRKIWNTSPLTWASEESVRFLGIEITKIPGGFALSQEQYIKELVRIHDVKPTQLDLIPVSRDQACFEASEEEAVFSVDELREAQQYAGEILWVSQRTRPDLAYCASLVSSLCARRAAVVARKCLGFLQRTSSYQLKVLTQGNEITSWSDASFAPEGSRSHSGWLVLVGSSPVSWRSARQSTVTLSTAESELNASVEGALALSSIQALLEDIGAGRWEGVLRTDSTSALSIQRGAGSWRTRHLRIKANWISERLGSGELRIEHCPGEEQIADALTKALSSFRLRKLSRKMGLKTIEEILLDTEVEPTTTSSSSTTSMHGFKILVALLVLSQAVVGCDASREVVVYEPMTVDSTLVMWGVFAVIALLWTMAWEMIKYAGWQMYYEAIPGASARRMRRLQRLRDTTTEAIQRELHVRRQEREHAERPVEVRRAQSADRLPGYDNRDPGRSESSARVPSTPLGDGRTVYGSNQKDRATQTTGPSFAPCPPQPAPEIHIPENVFIVPGNQCYHLFNPCHAFRHRGTQSRVQGLRICEYCVRHHGRDPALPGPGVDELLRAGLRPNFDRPGAFQG